MPKRPPTSSTRRGNGATHGPGYGGPAKGAGRGKAKQGFGPGTNAQGHNATTPETRAALRREQLDRLMQRLYDLAMHGQSESACVQAATAFANRVEGMPVARQELKLNIDPAELSDAELATIARGGDHG